MHTIIYKTTDDTNSVYYLVALCKQSLQRMNENAHRNAWKMYECEMNNYVEKH